jgi:hypothetical protein
MRRWIGWSILFVASLAVMPTVQAAEPATAETPVKLKVLDPAGKVVCCQTFALHGAGLQLGQYRRSPLLLLEAEDPAAEPLVCDSAECLRSNGEPVVVPAWDYSLCVKRSTGMRQSPGWDEPSQQLLLAVFADGSRGVLRLAEGINIGHATLSLNGETVAMEPCTPLQYAVLLRAGAPVEDAAGEVAGRSPNNWVMAADVDSLVAFSTGVGQPAALRQAAMAVQQLLAAYRAKYGHYPPALNQLWQGMDGVVALGPDNPYDWGVPLCTADPPYSVQHGLIYAVEGDHYWLAVMDEGQPEVATPKYVPEAVRGFLAVQWLESSASASP